jgi:hypothetical protein
LRSTGYFLIALILATLYAALVGLVIRPIETPLILWPIFFGGFWFVFYKLISLRYAGFLAVPPVAILAFEIARTSVQPPVYAYRIIALDRSHYRPGTRLNIDTEPANIPDTFGSGVKEILIGNDGFRANPDTGVGNPERCTFALIGDSMIYGSGLRYADTLRPHLAAMGLNACVFGVTGNGPVDYLSTLRYVADRIEPRAHVAIYLYAYNDFTSLTKYYRRRFRVWSAYAHRLSGLAMFYDDWRKTTWIYGSLNKAPNRPARRLWRYKIGNKGAIKFYHHRDPTYYIPPPSLTRDERLSFSFFLESLKELTRARHWRVSLVILPDNEEFYANVAAQSEVFRDRDPRRANGLAMCRKYPLDCEDLTHYLYRRSRAEGRFPYLMDDRHFSAFGMRLVAEHYKRIAERQTGPSKSSELDGASKGSSENT